MRAVAWRRWLAGQSRRSGAAALAGVLALTACGSGGRTLRGTAPAAVSVALAVSATPTAPPSVTAEPSVAATPSPAPPIPEPAAPPPASVTPAPPARAVAPRPALPRPLQAAWVVDRGNPARGSVALTFDAGADRGYADLILNVLQEEGVPATFGMTGVWAQANPDLVQRMVAEGHRLMNHTYDHTSFTGLSTIRRPLSAEQRRWQLARTEELLVELTGQSTLPLFRSPYGDNDGSVLRDLAANGYAYNVLWTIDSRGWLRSSAAQIIDRCLRLAEPGAIYVFHVGGQSLDGPALRPIIQGLRAAGYTFETVDEILQ